MKKIAKAKHDPIAEIPQIVGIDPIAIQISLAIVVPLDIPDVRIAIGVG